MITDATLNPMEIGDETVELVYKQAPIECTREMIRTTLMETQNDISKALDILWNIPKPPPKPFKFLDDVREIADACDRQMEERDMKNKYFKQITPDSDRNPQ